MKLGAAFLADAAMPNFDGTFMVWRGGIDTTWSPTFPATVKYVVILRLEFDEQEIRQLHRLSLSVFFEGQQVWEAPPIPLAVPETPGESRYYANTLMAIQFVASSEGRGHIQAMIDDVALPQQHFRVRRGLPPMPGQPPAPPPAPSP